MNDCTNCDCTTHSIRTAGGCPRSTPAPIQTMPRLPPEDQSDSAIGDVWPYMAMAVIVVIGLASWAVGVFG